jgi:hypothetical protein
MKICDINATNFFTTVTTSVTDWLMQCAYKPMDGYSENKNIKQENKTTESRYLLNEREK